MTESSFENVSILVVEDDAASARMIATLLASEGASMVRVAHSAEEALVILTTVPVRVLIVDLGLPAMSGLELVRRVKADIATRGTTVIAVTGTDGHGIMRDARDSGCAACLRKPFEGERFVDTVVTSLRAVSIGATT
jgi:CheY-like chemotaxis protein